jgi:hypothetical protein
MACPLRSGFICGVLLCFAGALSAQASINIDVDGVQKAVVFLYGATANGEVDKQRPLGTGFFVGVPIKNNSSKVYPVLVTARHIFDPVWAKCGGSNPTMVFARINKREENVEKGASRVAFIPIQLTAGDQAVWSHHADDDVDAAAIIIGIPQSDVDASALPISMFPTAQETAAQSIGDPIMSAGLLPNLPGISRNYPIFKFGQISNIPAEDVETRCFAQGPTFSVKVWLIAANLVPGNSGSPMFHVPLGGSGVSFGGTRPMLLGVQSLSFLGADVAGMTPIKFVYEILQKMNLPDPDFGGSKP